ncbi:MAG: dihydroorotate dehydrogenase-like protein [Planctomycetota bacterium]|jgi:dihydroorotate dehydrogenase (fumarate)
MDLSTNYMGLKLANPFVASASPLSMDIEKVKLMAEAGMSAVVLASLFEEQVQQDAEQLEYFLQYGSERFAESLSFYPHIEDFQLSSAQYLDYIADLKRAVGIPIIASLNGVSNSGWLDYARHIEFAGADALELNINFLPSDPLVPSEMVERAHVSIVESVADSVGIPVAVKLSPFFSAPAHIAKRLVEAGAKGLVLFNRFYEPDINVEYMEVTPRLTLSTSTENRLPLRWIAILYGRVEASLAATTGIHTAQDAAKMILAGADVVEMASVLLEHGPCHATDLHAGLLDILESKGYGSLSEMRGALSHANTSEPSAFERANYIKTIGCFKAVGTRE